MRLKHWRLLLVVAMLPLLYTLAAAQEPQSNLPETTTILNRINASRLRENLVHLVPNDSLNQIAEAWVNDLTTRPIDGLGDVYSTRAMQTIEDVLEDEGLRPYANNFIVDFIPIVVRDFSPDQIIDFWVSDFRQAEPQLRTLRNIRFNDPQLPIFSAIYREIGIAWRFNETTQRHYYALVFAAQPNVLPVVATRRGAIDEIAGTVQQPEIVLYIHDERVNRFGQGDTLGAVDKIRIAEQPGELPCEADSPDWQPYTNEVLWTLSAEPGPKAIYVQMCDTAGRSIVSSTQVTYNDGSSVPDLSGIVQATQTAVAETTRVAPFMPTIESILTATAQALATPTPAPDA